MHLNAYYASQIKISGTFINELGSEENIIVIDVDYKTDKLYDRPAIDFWINLVEPWIVKHPDVLIYDVLLTAQNESFNFKEFNKLMPPVNSFDFKHTTPQVQDSFGYEYYLFYALQKYRTDFKAEPTPLQLYEYNYKSSVGFKNAAPTFSSPLPDDDEIKKIKHLIHLSDRLTKIALKNKHENMYNPEKDDGRITVNCGFCDCYTISEIKGQQIIYLP